MENLPVKSKAQIPTLLPKTLSLKPQICPSPKQIQFQPHALLAPMSLFFLSPRRAWKFVQAEKLTATQIFEKYVFLLAGIGPLAGALGYSLSGRLSPSHAIGFSLAAYGLNILFFFGATYFSYLLAPAFGGKMSIDDSAKLIVFSFMPFFLFLAFFLFPPISFLSLIGVYGIILFYRGIPVMSRLPQSQIMLFFILNAVVWIFFVEMMRCAVFGG